MKSCTTTSLSLSLSLSLPLSPFLPIITLYRAADTHCDLKTETA